MKRSILIFSSILLLSGCVTNQQERIATRGAAVVPIAGAVTEGPEAQLVKGVTSGFIIGAASGFLMSGKAQPCHLPKYARKSHYHRYNEDHYLRGISRGDD